MSFSHHKRLVEEQFFFNSWNYMDMRSNFVTNQFATTCDYLLFMIIIGYFYNYFLDSVVFVTTLKLISN
jgi:hypothetical protein